MDNESPATLEIVGLFADLAVLRAGRSVEQMLDDPSFVEAFKQLRRNAYRIIHTTLVEEKTLGAPLPHIMLEVEQRGYFTAFEAMKLMEATDDLSWEVV